MPTPNNEEGGLFQSTTERSGSRYWSGVILSLIGVFFLLMSIPAKWEVSFVSGYDDGNMALRSGWFIALEIFLITCLVGSYVIPMKDIPTCRLAVVSILCAMIFFYALYTLFGILASGTDEVNGASFGIKAGSGIWLGIMGSLICLVGQGMVAVSWSIPLLKQVNATTTETSKKDRVLQEHLQKDYRGNEQDIAGKIQQLAMLMQQGLITEDEYTSKKRDLLRRM